MKKVLFSFLVCLTFTIFFLGFGSLNLVSAQTINLKDYIVGPNFKEHLLTTGEIIRFSGEGGSGPGSPARMYKGGNYEQFFVGNGIYRREDTSWAPLAGFGDALCANGHRAIYTLDPGCKKYTNGQAVTSDGALWAPGIASVGQTWNTAVHQIVTIDSISASGGSREYCSLTNLGGYDFPQACDQSSTLKLTAFIPKNSAPALCSGVSNPEDMIKIETLSGPGTGDIFYFMKGWGLVGFEAPGFEAGLVLPEGIFSNNCTVEQANICRTARDEEYHSLRPYPACPRNPQMSATSMICGNSLTVIDTKSVFPENGSCTPPDQKGNITCSYSFKNQTADISVDLSNAELPILGNTESVANSENKNNEKNEKLDHAAKVNDYVSWYLNGVINRAEYPFLDLASPTDISKIINFSGPLNKLLPQEVQWYTREATIDRQPRKQHDQVASCSIGIDIPQICIPFTNICIGGRQIGGFPAPCYDNNIIIQSILIIKNRLDEWSDRKPPHREDFEKYSDYFKAYKEWRGELCLSIPIPILGNNFLMCLNDFGGVLREDTWGETFPYIPYSSTEDRVGAGTAAVPVTQIINSESKIENIQFKSKSGKLFFPHTEEVASLARTLQGTYVPMGASNEILDDVSQVDIGPECKILNTRTNDGDSLYGNKITGKLTYDLSFKCNFNITEPRSECVKNSAISVDVNTLAPRLDEIWSRLVAGSFSVFRRMLPKTGVNSPINNIKDIPGSTKANYSVTGDEKSLGGNPSEIYIPHIGGLQEYFLQGIQTALRPKGFSSSSLPGGYSSSCSIGLAPYCNAEKLSYYFGGDMEKATKASIICQRESGSNPGAKNLGCLTGKSVDYSIGLFQINLLAHCPGALKYTWEPIWCDVIDEAKLEKCENDMLDPEKNIQKMLELSNNGTNWSPWSASAACNIQ